MIVMSFMKGDVLLTVPLCAVWDLKYKSFNSAQKPIRITTVEFSNSAPLAQNRC